MNNTKILMKLKDEIEEARTNLAQEQGKIESAEERLKTDFNLNNVEDAEKYIKKLENQMENKQDELDEGVKKLQEAFDL